MTATLFDHLPTATDPDRRPCTVCGTPCALSDPTDPDSWAHDADGEWGDHTAEVAAPAKPKRARIEPRILFPDEREMARWVPTYQALLNVTLSRSDLYAIAEREALGYKTELRRAKKYDLARDVAYNDAALLGSDWPASPYFQEQVDRAWARVQASQVVTDWPATIVGPEHRVVFRRSDEYGHLFQPACTCGWQVTGYTTEVVARLHAQAHADTH